MFASLGYIKDMIEVLGTTGQSSDSANKIKIHQEHIISANLFLFSLLFIYSNNKVSYTISINIILHD